MSGQWVCSQLRTWYFMVKDTEFTCCTVQQRRKYQMDLFVVRFHGLSIMGNSSSLQERRRNAVKFICIAGWYSEVLRPPWIPPTLRKQPSISGCNGQISIELRSKKWFRYFESENKARSFSSQISVLVHSIANELMTDQWGFICQVWSKKRKFYSE